MSNIPKRSVAVDADRLAQIESLLSQYPNLNQDERQQILQFLRKAPILDRGLLTGNQSVAWALEAFRHDHDKELSLGWREFLMVAAVAVLFLIVVAFLWNSGMKN